jgi:hypothetical protein
MRFGKTFTGYQLAKGMDARRVLVVTFKPAVEDSWQTDLESHTDFEGWRFISRKTEGDPLGVAAETRTTFLWVIPSIGGVSKNTNPTPCCA